MSRSLQENLAKRIAELEKELKDLKSGKGVLKWKYDPNRSQYRARGKNRTYTIEKLAKGFLFFQDYRHKIFTKHLKSAKAIAEIIEGEK